MPMIWTYSLVIRSKNSVGTVLHTYTAGSSTPGPYQSPVRCGPPTYEPVRLDREALDRSRDSIVVGFRSTLRIAWEVKADEVLGLTGIGTTADLKVVLSDLTTAGNYLEVSLNGAGGTFRRVNLISSYEPQPLGGKAVGIALELEFEGANLLSAVPDASAAGW